jgi:competence protein ComEA
VPPAGPIDVDVADATALDALPGIGPSLAGRIVAERAANGPFGSLDGLQRVRGIGPALAGRLAPHVTFSGVSRLPGASGTHVRRRSARR